MIVSNLAEETREGFQQNKARCSTHVQGDIEVALVQNYYGPNRTDITCEVALVFLVRRRGQFTPGVGPDPPRGAVFLRTVSERFWVLIRISKGFFCSKVHQARALGNCWGYWGIILQVVSIRISSLSTSPSMVDY